MRLFNRIVSLGILVCCGHACGGELTGTASSNVAYVLSLPAGCFPGRSFNEIRDFLSQSNLLSELCENWKVGKTAEERISLLEYSFALYTHRRNLIKGRPRDMQAEDIIARALVAALSDDDRGVRRVAAKLLEQCHVNTVRKFANQIVDAVRKNANTDAILVLGSTGVESAAALLLSEPAFRNCNKRRTELALAKLGNKACEEKVIREFKAEVSPDKQFSTQVCWDLAYIGTDSAVKALAEELRTSVIFTGRNWQVSARVRLIDAIHTVYTNETIFVHNKDFQTAPANDGYYQKIEEWAERKFNISWKTNRPPFFVEAYWGVPF